MFQKAKNREASAGADNFLFQVRSLPSLITGIVEKTFTHQKAKSKGQDLKVKDIQSGP